METKKYLVGFEGFNRELHDLCIEVNKWLEDNPKAKLVDIKYQSFVTGLRKEDSDILNSIVIIVEEPTE